MTAGTVIAVLAIIAAYVLGAMSFRRINQWCPRCGATFRCPDCPGAPTPGEAHASIRRVRRRADRVPRSVNW